MTCSTNRLLFLFGRIDTFSKQRYFFIFLSFIVHVFCAAISGDLTGKATYSTQTATQKVVRAMVNYHMKPMPEKSGPNPWFSYGGKRLRINLLCFPLQSVLDFLVLCLKLTCIMLGINLIPIVLNLSTCFISIFQYLFLKVKNLINFFFCSS